MGQPVLGRYDNVMNITRQNVVDFHRNNYVGENIVVVGTGDVDHNKLKEIVRNTFGTLPKQGTPLVSEKPKFQNLMMRIHEQDIHNQPLVKIITFFEAPSHVNEDYFSFLLL